MPEWVRTFGQSLGPEHLMAGVRAVSLLLIGFLVASLVSRALSRVARRRLEPSSVILLRRLTYYGLLTLFVTAGLNQLGFDLGILLGAAGVLTVAFGFASQTSASNLVSGLFLMFERPFSVGDVIEVGGTTGEVLSIDLLSAKLRTFDNLYVRIPNEDMIKSEVRTLTRFPIRRIDLQIGVAYREDLERVRKVLFDLAERNPLCLDEPAPLFIFKGFGDSALEIQFSPWATRENWLTVKTGLQLAIKQAFDREGIEIPFPHRTLFAGTDSEPLPIRLVGDEPRAAGGGDDDEAADRD